MDNTSVRSEDIQLQRHAKNRRVRLKKFLIDYSTVRDYVSFDSFNRGIKFCGMRLENPAEAKQFFADKNDRVSLNQVMSVLYFKEIDESEIITVEIRTQDMPIFPRGGPVLPELNTIHHHEDFQTNPNEAHENAFKTLQPPSDPKPKYTRQVNPGKEASRPNTSQSQHNRSLSVNPALKNTFRYGYTFDPYVKNLNQYDVSALPRAKNHKTDLYLHYQNPKSNPVSMDEALISCQQHNLDYRYLFALVSHHMKLDKMNTGIVRVEDFMDQAAALRKVIAEDTLNKVVACCTEISPVTGEPVMVLQTLSTLVDKYKFQPKRPEAIRHKNNSSQFATLALGKKPHFETKVSDNQEHLAFLRERLEEKFTRISDTLRFFDKDLDSKITLTEFQTGLDNLAMRMDVPTILEMFKIIDTKHDNIIDLDELCEFFEIEGEGPRAAKETIDPYTYTPNKNIKFIHNTAPKPSFRDSAAHDPNIDVSLNPELEHMKKNNILLRKAPIGKAFVRGFSAPRAAVSTNFTHGKPSAATENMHDIMTNNYEREWLQNSIQNENERRERLMNVVKRKTNDADILRSNYIRNNLSTTLPGGSGNNTWRSRRPSHSRNGVKVADLENRSLTPSSIRNRQL